MAPESLDVSLKRKRDNNAPPQECPYLNTVERSLLDFDLEPLCSVSLEAGPHIYACLVCGKFFRGRGKSTPAYTHSLEESHYIVVHLQQGSFYCLPDDYEVQDPSLNDISAALHPTFTPQEIATIDSNTDLSRDLFGKRYLSGFVGLNNLNTSDCINAVVQALAHVIPLRDFFLSSSCSIDQHKLAGKVTQAFADVVRKIWSRQRFKSHIDPHVLVETISSVSSKKFGSGQQAEAGELMSWMLHQLHVGTGGGKKPGSSIVHKIFQGMVTVTTRQKVEMPVNGNDADEDDRAGSDVDDEEETNAAVDEAARVPKVVIEEKTTDQHFLQLTLDIPEKPLFRDEDGGLVIPQEPLVSVLRKFDGVTFSDALGRSGVAQRRCYQLRELPKYLILVLNRFKTNQYSREKNPTIVSFPVKNLDLSQYIASDRKSEVAPSESQIRGMSVSLRKKKSGL